MNPAQISYAVLYEGQTLKLDHNPDVMGTLALCCMNPDPSKRPTAAEIVQTIGRHLAVLPPGENRTDPNRLPG